MDKKRPLKKYSEEEQSKRSSEDSFIIRGKGYQEETLETAGCTGGCPTYPGAPKTGDGYPDCSKCPQFQKEEDE